MSGTQGLGSQIAGGVNSLGGAIEQSHDSLRGSSTDADLTSVLSEAENQFDTLFDILHEIYDRQVWTNKRIENIEIALGDFYVLDAGATYEGSQHAITTADEIFHA